MEQPSLKDRAKIIGYTLLTIILTTTTTAKLVDVFVQKKENNKTKRELVATCPLIFPNTKVIPSKEEIKQSRQRLSLDYQQELLYLYDELWLSPAQIKEKWLQEKIDQKLEELQCIDQAIEQLAY